MACTRSFLRMLSKAPIRASLGSGSDFGRFACRSFVATAIRRAPETPQTPQKAPETPPEYNSLMGKPSKKVADLAEQIVTLNIVEVADLVDLLKTKLGLTNMQLMMPAGGGGAPSAADGGGSAAAAATEKKEEKKEKTEFAIKLDSFNAADKLKVIKEIRAITGLGLKESKELVEGAPKTIKEGVSKEEAEKMKKQIEDSGGKVTIS